MYDLCMISRRKPVFRCFHLILTAAALVVLLHHRRVLEVSALHRPTAVFEIQHLGPERRSRWGVRTQRPAALTHTG